ncbi:butyrophilin subfamily 2 member A2-like [Ctenodactylus gundi]
MARWDPAPLRPSRMARWGLRPGPLLLWLLLPWPGSGQFQVTGPKSPVIALVEEEVVIPCYLSPPTDAEDMEVSWYRNQQSSLVYQYRKGNLENQSPEYEGRTEFLRGNITRGQVALRISFVQPSDEGMYSCVFASPTHRAGAQFRLLVTGSGAAPRIHIAPGDIGTIRLTCVSAGWFPEPELQWKDAQGQDLDPSSMAVVLKDGLFHMEASVTVKQGSSEDVSCWIRNPILNVEKEAHVSMADVSPGPAGSEECQDNQRWREVVEGQEEDSIRGHHWNQGAGKKDSVEKVKSEVMVKMVQSAPPSVSSWTHRLGSLDADLRKAREFARDIRLDANTAHPALFLSGDGKYVEQLPTRQDVPDHPARFTAVPAVLGRNIFSKGSHYWEVDVAGKNRWKLGLCAHSVHRKNPYIYTYPENGFWTLSLKDGLCQALSMPRYNIDVPKPLTVVGVFLQYEEGLISFYDVTERTVLYTFKSNFTQPLRPYFSSGPPVPGNEVGLEILPVQAPGTSAPV